MKESQAPQSSPCGGGCPSSQGEAGGEISRRSFLRKSAVVAGGLAATLTAMKPLMDLDSSEAPSVEKMLQKHYKEMSPEEMKEALARISKEVEKRYDLRPEIRDIKPMDGVEFVYALNLSLCVGCRKCVHACVAENNQSRSPEIQYIRVLEMPSDTIDLNQGNQHYNSALVPKKGKYYMPVQCHQCAEPPCVEVCPVEATWQEPDGITVVDYDWCIGCRFCEAACPYWARRFNFTTPKIPKQDINPNMSYLSNRPRPKGVMEKCTFCLHRTREGKMPACLEVCPTGSRKFGNLLDPNSEVSQILKNNRVFVLKEDVGTMPRFFYYFEEDYPNVPNS